MLCLKSSLFKSTDWADEKDWRLIRRETENEGKYSSMPLKPSAIYCGIRMDNETRKILLNIAKGLGLEAYQMRIDIASEGYDMKGEKVL